MCIRDSAEPGSTIRFKVMLSFMFFCKGLDVSVEGVKYKRAFPVASCFVFVGFASNLANIKRNKASISNITKE